MTDIVVIGAGHNGLTCASYLAMAGHKVLVLEAGEVPGGCAATREFHDGFRVSSAAHYLTMLNPTVASDLALEQHGLTYAARDLPTVALAEDGAHLVLDGASVSGVSAQDQAAWTAFYQQTARFSGVLANAFAKRPPNLVDRSWQDTISLLKLGWDIRTLGKADMQDLLRLALINIYDVANEAFDSELLKAAVALDGVLGSHMGPRSPNTVVGYLYRRLGDAFGFNGPALPVGGMGAVGEAFAAAARAKGVELRTGATVVRVLLEGTVARGVVLDSGEEIAADLVVSGADPKTTLGTLVGLPNLDVGFARRVHNLRSSGDTAKLHLALDALPEFTGLEPSQTGDRLLLAPDMDYIERAFNHAKYGEYSQAPAMEISIPTVHDTSLAPPGKHVLSAVVQYAPYELKAGWDSQRATFVQQLIERLAAYAPGLEKLVIASELLTPQDLEAQFRMTGGHWHHGELSIDQLMMMRPFPGANQYRTPIKGLYLCSAGAHPGGGVMGLAGKNAASEIIKGGTA